MSEEKSLSAGGGSLSGKDTTHPRRVYIVDAKLQFKIVFHLFLLSSLVGVLGGLLTALYFLHRMSSHPGHDPTVDVQVLFLGLAVATSALLIVAIAGIFISHAIAGPAHRFRQIMRAVVEKREVPAVGLRRHDYLQGMADDLEALLVALKNETDAAAQTAREASEGIARTAAALKAGGQADPALLAELAEIQGRLAQAAGEAKAR